MTQNATLIFDSLFLHETQMTDLEREQTTLRKLYSRLKTERMPAAENGKSSIVADRPFNFAPPFCPLAAGIEFAGKLTIGAPAAIDGWIVRPVSGQKCGEARNEPDTTAGDIPAPNASIAVPGYPPLPGGTCFILGYAGDFAEALLARALRNGDAETRSAPASFSVSARYRATLTLETSHEKGKLFSCIRTVGPARWEKA